jgi:ketosteroid isomerase-like protein
MSEQDVQNLRGAYDGFNAGDPQVVIGLMADDVEWNEPGGGNSAKGTFTSPQSVAQEVFGLIPDNFDEFAANPENFDDRGDAVVVTGRFKGKAKSGADLDTSFEHSFEFEDGKIKRFNNNVDQEAWTAGWS